MGSWAPHLKLVKEFSHLSIWCYILRWSKFHKLKSVEQLIARLCGHPNDYLNSTPHIRKLAYGTDRID